MNFSYCKKEKTEALGKNGVKKKIVLYPNLCYIEVDLISSVTISSTRNDKNFGKFQKVTFLAFFSKNDQKGPKTQIQPHVPKSMSCILQEKFW